jgi:ABC-type sugar transport system permease subunit
VRVLLVPFLIVVGLLIIALLLPSKKDSSVAAWWARVCYQAIFFTRVALALAFLAAIVWFVLLPMFGLVPAVR